MKKMMVLLASVFVLTAYTQPNNETKEQQSIVESITDGTKMSLSMSDLMMK